MKKVLKRTKVKNAVSWEITSAIVSAFFFLLSFFFVYILFWLMMSTLKTHTEIVVNPFKLPKKLMWSNYKDMLSVFTYNNTSFGGMLFNSVWHSVGGAVIQVWSTCSIAYLSQKYKFPGAKLIAPFVMFTILFPLYGTGGASYRLIFKMGFANSPLILVTAGMFLSWNFFYFQAFFATLSWSYAEAAFIDGANDWQVYYKIMLPQSMGIIGAIGIGVWAATWQDYGTQILYLTKLPTLSVGIYYFKQQMVYRARMDVLYCACFISSIPIILLYGCFNKLLFKNISLGGIKM